MHFQILKYWVSLVVLEPWKIIRTASSLHSPLSQVIQILTNKDVCTDFVLFFLITNFIKLSLSQIICNTVICINYCTIDNQIFILPDYGSQEKCRVMFNLIYSSTLVKLTKRPRTSRMLSILETVVSALPEVFDLKHL